MKSSRPLLLTALAGALAGVAGATPITLQGYLGLTAGALFVNFDTADAVRLGVTSNVSSPSAWMTGSGWTAFRAQQLGGPHTAAAQAMGNTRLQMIDVGVFGPGLTYDSSVRYPSFRGIYDERGGLSLAWGADLGSPNHTGPDLLILEWGGNEGYWINLRTASGWSGPRYVPAALSLRSGSSPNSTLYSWGTLVDYDWFGVRPGGLVREILLTSVLAGDRGTSSDGGFSFAPDPAGALLINPQTNQPFSKGAGPPYYTGSDLTADIWYVVSLSEVASVREAPEPATAWPAAGGLAALAWLRRRRAR